MFFVCLFVCLFCFFFFFFFFFVFFFQEKSLWFINIEHISAQNANRKKLVPILLFGIPYYLFTTLIILIFMRI